MWQVVGDVHGLVVDDTVGTVGHTGGDMVELTHDDSVRYTDVMWLDSHTMTVSHWWWAMCTDW